MTFTLSIQLAATSLLVFTLALTALLPGSRCYYSYLGYLAIGKLSHTTCYQYAYSVMTKSQEIMANHLIVVQIFTDIAIHRAMQLAWLKVALYI